MGYNVLIKILFFILANPKKETNQIIIFTDSNSWVCVPMWLELKGMYGILQLMLNDTGEFNGLKFHKLNFLSWVISCYCIKTKIIIKKPKIKIITKKPKTKTTKKPVNIVQHTDCTQTM